MGNAIAESSGQIKFTALMAFNIAPERNGKMKTDPFGNLTDWGPVLDTLADLTDTGNLSQCQPGLVRILRYKGNWRLREEVLKCIGVIQGPSKDLLYQVLSLLDDDNIYHDARIMAGKALMQLLKNNQDGIGQDIYDRTRRVVEKIKSTPQPPFFENAVDQLYAELAIPDALEN